MKKLFFFLILFLTIPLVNLSAAPTPTPTKVQQKIVATPTKTQQTASTKTDTLAKPVLQWHCLNNVYCSDTGAGCATGADVVAGHRVKLRTKDGDLPQKNSPTYIFVCITTNEGNLCTSQSSDVDITTLGYDGVTKLNQATGYQAQGVYKPQSTVKLTQQEIANIKANQHGKLTLDNKLIEGMEMQDYTPAGMGRKWLALNMVAPINLPSGKGGDQQGTFTFEGALAQCIAISWDPYGIVFDSQSLEPVSGATVTLNRKRPNGQYTIFGGDEAGSILNPQTTVEDGAFSFYVPDGTYKLDVGKTNFTFPNLKTLSPNYNKIYSDIYHGEDIVQKGTIQHRDIPIDSKGLPYTSTIKILSYFTMLNKVANEYIVQGRVTHPLAVIKVFGKKPAGQGKDAYIKTKLLMTSKTNKLGQFEIRIDLTKLDKTEVVGDIEFIKPNYKDLTGTGIDETNKATLSVEPILNYVEGYAYDDFGKPMTNVTVGVYLSQAVKPILEVKTDEKGFYKITSEYLPPMSFGMKYSQPTGGVYTVSTTKFIAQNAKYIEEQQEKIYTYKDKSGNSVKVTSPEKQTNRNGEFGSANIPNERLQGGVSEKKLSQKSAANNIVMVIALVLVLVGVVGIVLAFYLMKKREQNTTL